MEEYLLPGWLANLFRRRNVHEKDSYEKRLRSANRHRGGGNSTVQQGKERMRGAAQDRAFRRSEMDADHKGMRPGASFGRFKRGRSAVRPADPVCRRNQTSRSLASRGRTPDRVERNFSGRDGRIV